MHRIGNLVKREVNKAYRRLVIEIDGIYSCVCDGRDKEIITPMCVCVRVFSSMLLLAKKKYAAMVLHEHADGSHTTSRELKARHSVSFVCR